MTKKEMFVAIKAVVAENQEMVDFLDHEIELLTNRKSNGNTKSKAESDARKAKLLAALSEMDKPVSIAELKATTSDPDVAEWTSQRISGLFSRMDEVDKVMDKKVAKFFIKA